MSYIILSTDGPEPVSLAEAKAHLRVVDNDEDALIETYIAAARSHCERFLGLSLVNQTIKATFLRSELYRPQMLLRLNELPRKTILDLPLSPVDEIIEVADGEGEPVEHTAFLGPIPAVLRLESMPELISVTYKTVASTLNATLKIAVLMILHQMYEYRGDIPDNVILRNEEAYLRPMRVNLGMA
jgi:hypothetical protein